MRAAVNKDAQINVYMTEPAVTVLGPGTRYVVWVQGCRRACPGCVAASSHREGAGRLISAGTLALDICLSGADGLTISGGEPFLQAEALAAMVRKVRQKRDLGVIVYTGYLYEELQALPQAEPLLAVTDLLIDGPYIRELDDGKSLRGSSNQRVIPLTERYRDALTLYGTAERKVQQFRHGFERHRVGLPNRSYDETTHQPTEKG